MESGGCVLNHPVVSSNVGGGPPAKGRPIIDHSVCERRLVYEVEVEGTL